MVETKVTLPDKTKERIVALILQGQAIQKQATDTISVALEAMGHDGSIKSFDPKTGDVVVVSENGSKPNRAQRRRNGKAGSQTAQE